MSDYINEIGKRAKDASKVISTSNSKTRNDALAKIKCALVENTAFIISENEKDIDAARKSGVREAMIDRLTLDQKRICDIASSIDSVILHADPIGVGNCFFHQNGMRITKLSVPLGVVAMIFEARPNVTCDAAMLSIKSGNAVILRGGREAINTNIALSRIMRDAICKAGLPADCIQLIEKTDHETASELFRLNEYVDVLIPRGGASLINAVVASSTVPVIQTGAGNCHIFIDESADLSMAVDILYNGKTSRPSVCNALESMLVCESIADKFLPLAQKKLSEKNVKIYGCEKTCAILPEVEEATDEDYYKEYNDYIISVKVVKDIFEAVEHINSHSTHHSEAIITKNMENAEYFKKHVDSAAVYVNASTRFTDGGEFGLGAEIGISTQKLHARGPMGLEALTTVKFTIDGNGQVR